MNKLPLTYIILRRYIVVLSLLLFLQVFASLNRVLDQNKLYSIYLFLFFLSLRMIIHWPAFPCWVTQSPSPQSLKTSTRTMSSSCISSPTSTTSDRRANTLLRGTRAHMRNISICSCVESLVSEGWSRRVCLPAGGWKWSAVPQSLPGALVSWTTKSPTLTESTLVLLWASLRWHLQPPPPNQDFAFLFYTYLEHLYMCPCTFGAFFNALMVTRPLV